MNKNDEWTPCYGIFFSHDGDDDAAGGYVVLPVERRRSLLYPGYWSMRWTSRGESHERHMASKFDFYDTEDTAWQYVLLRVRSQLVEEKEKLERTRRQLVEVERLIASRTEGDKD